MTDSHRTPIFQHFILTRFNLRIWGNSAPADSWLAHRLDLFERFCLPSVLGQSVQQFTWLLLFDQNTPDSFRERVARYTEVANIELVFLDGFDVRAIIAAVTERVSAETTHIISTTLDNDDALGKQFVETIQAHFEQQQFTLIN
ncbi:MAG TPA: hypothetical protein ENJ56_06205, partial [Anaerolineae bacterium]|nr:hypothetical protein [Anaerolineae bacterium]